MVKAALTTETSSIYGLRPEPLNYKTLRIAYLRTRQKIPKEHSGEISRETIPALTNLIFA